MTHIYDVIILGGGPAGFTAALYATRSGLDTLLIEKLSVGGQMTETTQIDNYPGFDEGIDGFSLGDKMKKGAERFGAKTIFAEILSVQLKNKVKTIKTSEGSFFAHSVIIATGAGHKHLGIEREDSLRGKGLAYCATCDGMFYRNKTVGVVGGGNSAVADALVLSRTSKNVIIIHRRDTFRATKIYHDQLLKAENIKVIWNSTVEKLLGENSLSGVELRNVKSGEVSNLNLDGLFISIGRDPQTQLFKEQVALDEFGYIVADESTKTNLDGVFAIGDVRTKALRQIVTAAADGAVAAYYAEEYLANKN